MSPNGTVRIQIQRVGLASRKYVNQRQPFEKIPSTAKRTSPRVPILLDILRIPLRLCVGAIYNFHLHELLWSRTDSRPRCVLFPLGR